MEGAFSFHGTSAEPSYNCVPVFRFENSLRARALNFGRNVAYILAILLTGKHTSLSHCYRLCPGLLVVGQPCASGLAQKSRPP